MTTPPQDGAHQPALLTGPAAEVDASPDGPGVGAFFDLDGTLVAGYTAAAQTRDRLRHRDLRVVEFLTIVELAVQFRLGRRAFETLIEGSARTIKGRLARDVDEMGERIFQQSVADLIYPEMRELVRAHQRRGHTVVLSSSALTNQVAPVARYLGIEHIMCNRLVADEQGILTGEIEQPVVWGPTKASGVEQFAVDHQVDLKSSYFYADGDEDLRSRTACRPDPTIGRYAAVDVRRLRRHGKRNSALADRMMENVEVIPNARIVHTKRKAWLELPMSPLITPRVPFMWMTVITSPRMDPKKMMMYPARLPPSTSVPYSWTTRTNTANRFTRPAGDIWNRMSPVRCSVMNKMVSSDAVVNMALCFM